MAFVVDGVEYILPEGISGEFVLFLLNLDAPEVRPVGDMLAVAQCFKHNGIGCKLELIGVDKADINSCAFAFAAYFLNAHLLCLSAGFALNAGLKGLMKRAIQAANASMVQALVDAAPAAGMQTDSSAVRDLVNVIKKEEVTVNIDLFTRINVRLCLHYVPQLFHVNVFALWQAISLNGLSDACFPTADAANKLASFRARDLKAKIAVPFPFMDLQSFVPSWAEEVLRFACLRMHAVAHFCLLAAMP